LTDDSDDEEEQADDFATTRKIGDIRSSFATQQTVGMSFTTKPPTTWHTYERKGSNRTLELEGWLIFYTITIIAALPFV
jgi:hypothetical protein